MKILIVEDEQIVAQNLIDLLTANGYEVYGPADRHDRGLDLFSKHHPDLILCDVKIKGSLSGIDLIRHLKQHNQFKTIFLTAYGDESLLAEAWKTQPEAFLLKPYSEKQLLVSIKMALEVKNLPSTSNADDDPKIRAYQELSLREKEILSLVSKGHTSKEISEELFISIHTVDTHRKKILAKMGFQSLIHLIIFVLKNGFDSSYEIKNAF